MIPVTSAAGPRSRQVSASTMSVPMATCPASPLPTICSSRGQTLRSGWYFGTEPRIVFQQHAALGQLPVEAEVGPFVDVAEHQPVDRRAVACQSCDDLLSAVPLFRVHQQRDARLTDRTGRRLQQGRWHVPSSAVQAILMKPARTGGSAVRVSARPSRISATRYAWISGAPACHSQ